MSRTGRKLLWVTGPGGPPFEFALPRLAAYADIYAVVPNKLNPAQEDLLAQWCEDVIRIDRSRSTSITADIVAAARGHRVDGIMTFAEMAVVAVAQACLALGLPGPGPHAALARDKWQMRKRWYEEGLPVPRFERVDGLPDLESAASTMKMPFLLKASGRGGGIGQQIISASTVLPDALARMSAALDEATDHDVVEYSELDLQHCLAEEIIESTTKSWYSDPRYGDFLSVEGMVSRGTYHPLCITARLPTLPPFVEMGGVSPCVLREDQQRKIEELAVAAVNALRLETCPTHTEMKLMADGRLCLLESAARPGGSTATSMSAAVFGVDVVTLQMGEALGIPQTYPEQMLVVGKEAAGSLYLCPADTTGTAWAGPTRIGWRDLDWNQLVSSGSRVEITPSQMIPDKTVVTPYHPGTGALNYIGAAMIYSSDPQTLLEDCYRLIDGLERAFQDQERGAGRETGD